AVGASVSAELQRDRTRRGHLRKNAARTNDDGARSIRSAKSELRSDRNRRGRRPLRPSAALLSNRAPASLRLTSGPLLSSPLLVRGEVGAIPIATGEVQRQHTRDAYSCTQAIAMRVM